MVSRRRFRCSICGHLRAVRNLAPDGVCRYCVPTEADDPVDGSFPAVEWVRAAESLPKGCLPADPRWKEDAYP